MKGKYKSKKMKNRKSKSKAKQYKKKHVIHKTKLTLKHTNENMNMMNTNMGNMNMNTNMMNTNESANETMIKQKSSKCAPYIQPTNLSKDKTLSQTNINIVESATDESCFTIDALRKIANKWNNSNPNMQITFYNTTSGKELWNMINKVMSNKCNTEICWMKQDFIKDSPLAKDLLKNNFKPLMPKNWMKNPREWLNTIDIRDVMDQYEIKYPDFEFVGPVPMDFDTKLGFGQCVVDELCKVKLNNLMAKGDTKLGVIFNLDNHKQPGSHWVAMYCDVKGKQICYWDSYGVKPSPEIVTLMDRLKKQGSDLGYDLEIKINNVRHQYKNSECGVYCIYFIISLLNGKKFEDVVNNIITDDQMNAKRKDFFNKSE